MFELLKSQEKKPISFASVEMQKAPRNYIRWIVAAVLGGVLLLYLLQECVTKPDGMKCLCTGLKIGNYCLGFKLEAFIN